MLRTIRHCTRGSAAATLGNLTNWRVLRKAVPALSVIAAVLLPLGGCETGQAGALERRNDASAQSGLEHLLEAVVRIDIREVDFSGGSRRLSRGVGSGVIIDERGYILTNAHVVSPDALEIRVTLANLERVSARLVGWDHWTDLALIQMDMDAVSARGHRFTVGRFGDSAALQTGQTVYAVGTPNGLTRTVTRGIISNPRRNFAASNQIRGYETGYFNNWLQTDAAINPGNSGGPLVDERGRIVGINTRSYLGANNLSFAVPAKIAEGVVAALRAQGTVVRSYIGIRPAPLLDLEQFFGLEANRGVLIESVDPGSPAAVAGLQAGDILLQIDGVAQDGRYPEQIPPIANLIASLPVGSVLRLDVMRGETVQQYTVTTEQLESRIGERDAFDAWGLSVQKVSRALARELQFETDRGVMVIGLQSAFPGETAGLQHGDVIVSINRQPIESLEDMRSLYADYAASPEKYLFEVMRDFRVRYIVLEPR